MEDWARQHDIVLWALPDSNAVQQVVDRYLLEVGAHALRRQEVCHVATVASLISAGMGMGFVPTFLADFYDRDTVGQIALPQGAPAVDFYCTSDASNPASSSIHVFSRLLAAHCSAAA
ncbi:LysR family transcriptional regulator [Bordetella pertussis]|nr:LysR family transcriptional regulator [Bordetella pertussis]